jgi:hypothetical protein
MVTAIYSFLLLTAIHACMTYMCAVTAVDLQLRCAQSFA